MTSVYPSRKKVRNEHRLSQARTVSRRTHAAAHRPFREVYTCTEPEMDLDSLTDDEFGKLVVQHSDRTVRDKELWDRITSPDHFFRAYVELGHMRDINELARSRRREELGKIKKSILESASEDSSASATLAQSAVWLRHKSEYDVWDDKAKHFNLRVSAALGELKLARIRQGITDSGASCWKLMDTVVRFLNDDIDRDELEDVLENVLLRGISVTGDPHERRVWAACEVQHDGTSIAPIFEDWHETAEDACKDVESEPGSVLGTAWVSSWSRDRC